MRLYLQVLTALSLLFITVLVNGQFVKGTTDNGILPKLIPSSPEASSLGKYGDWPMSYFSGNPNISIPLYTISTPNFELPITLSYHSGGVKIDEVGSWVGTNWSLSAGGVINRTVVGMPDEVYQGFLARNLRNEVLKTSYDLNTPNDFAFMMDVSRNAIDVEPDLFYFNFAGFSGKFYFDKTGKFQCIPVNSLKLLKSPINNTNSSPDDKHWEIADDKGNVYHFGSYMDGNNGLEDTKTSSTGNNLPYQTTAWYLTKIVVANSDEIIYFDYNSKYEAYTLPESHSFKFLTNGNGVIPYTAPGGTNWPQLLGLDQILVNGSPQGDLVTETVFNVSGKSQLSKIRWKYGEIVFNAPVNRSDITGKLLNNVQVKDKELKTIKNFDLVYNYVNSRYYLTSIDEKGSIGAKKFTYSFEYILPDQLPARGSYSQDHWGYFNGVNNTNLLPSNSQFPQLSYAANREPNISYAEKGSLKKITYPTGGTTEFIYEAHRYDPGSVVGGGPGSQIISDTKIVKAGNPQPSGFVRTNTFTVPFEQYTSSVSISFENYTKPASKSQAWLPMIKIEKLVGSTYQQVYYWDAFDNFPSSGSFTVNANGSVNFLINESIGLPVGEYRIVADLICGSGSCGTPSPMPLVSATLNYQASSGELPVAGGLRLKEMVSKLNGSETSRKKYQYAPGKIINYPVYVHEYAQDVYKMQGCSSGNTCINQCTYYFAKFKELTSSPQGILGMTSGASVGYPQVLEFSVDPSGIDNGYVEYKYNFVSDLINSMNLDGSYWSGVLIQNPLIPFNSNDFKRGLLISKTIFKKAASNQYRRVSDQINTYSFNEGNTSLRYNSLKGMRIKKMRIVQYDCGTSINGYVFPNNLSPAPDFGYGFYDLITAWVQLTSTEERFFDVDGNLVQTKLVNNAYNNSEYLQLSKTEVVNSKNEIIRTEFKYPYDYAGNSIYDGMKLKNLITPLIEIKESIVKSGIATLLQTTVNDYKVVGSYHKPDYVKLSLFNNTLENRARYISYDAAGNIQEMEKTNDKVQSIIWDNASGKPAAIFDNAVISDVAYTSFENDSKGNWVYSGLSQYELAPTGLKAYNLSNGSITKSGLSTSKIYVVSYWTKNSSAFTIAGTISNYPIMRTAVNGYRYVEHRVTGVSSISISGSGFIDELRLYPDKSECITYVYEPLVGIISMADKNAEPQRFIYDELGRLVMIKDVNGNILKQNCYSYFNESSPCSIVGNQQQSATFTKSCGSGFSGSNVTYTVPANTFYASTQADANALAIAKVNAYGQAYANSTGTCTSSSVTVQCNNTVSGGTFYMQYYNQSTGQMYNFNVSSTGYNINLGSIPAGTYTISIGSSIYNTNFYYSVACGFFNYGNNATFYNVNVDNTCKLISISPY